MNERTCIVTRQTLPPERMIRFVAGPDGAVVPDLKRNLPGRGCWVTAGRAYIEKAAARNLFSRALRMPVTVPADLAAMVDGLLSKAALGALGLARKAGAVALGAAKVESTVRSGRVAAVLHALEAAEDGIRKIAAARNFVVHAGGREIPAYRLFTEPELSLALGGANVIHAALLDGQASVAAQKRLAALDRYRIGFMDDRATVAAAAAEDTE